MGDERDDDTVEMPEPLDEQNEQNEQKQEPTYNPSGGIPSHPSDPGYGDSQPDDAVDASDEEG